MKKITSFTIDHTKLIPGIYISRIDGDVVTYDLRVCRPNHPPFMEVPAIHTIEHIFATLARNSEMSDSIIYFGPMGCRTGFYLLVRNPDHAAVIKLTRDCFHLISNWQAEIPGNSAAECGNYLEHDLATARAYAKNYLGVISQWDDSMLNYPN
jgi:S-ribosylhomocysteine lyase